MDVLIKRFSLLMLAGMLLVNPPAVRADDEDDDDDDRQTQLLQEIKVSGPVISNRRLPKRFGSNPTFEGELNITQLMWDGDELLASGWVEGKINGKGETIERDFSNIPLSLSEAAIGGVSIAQVTQVCEILTLDLGPLNLNLLGLVVDLSPVDLDVTAEAGPGNLLGNLLCAVAGLLDNFSLGDALSRILMALLDAINQLL